MLYRITTICLFSFILFCTSLLSQNIYPISNVVHSTIDDDLVSNTTVLANGDYEITFDASEAILNAYEEMDEDFGDIDLDDGMKYFWSFGDGNVSFDQNPTHHYTSGGSYQVSFQATPIYSVKPPPSMMIDDVTIDPNLNNPTSVLSGDDGFQPSTGITGLGIRTELVRDIRSSYESSLIITYKNESGLSNLNDAIEVYFDDTDLDIAAVYAYKGETLASPPIDDISAPFTGFLSDLNKTLKIQFTDLDHLETRRIVLQFVSNSVSPTLNDKVYIGANFLNNSSTESDFIRSSMRRSWDPNAKEVFQDFIAPPNIPNAVKYRLYMENEGSDFTSYITLVDGVPEVLKISNSAIIDDQKNNIPWYYEIKPTNDSVAYSYPLELAPQSEKHDLEDSKYWMDVVYEIDEETLNDNIQLNGGQCKEGNYQFGEAASIIFYGNPAIQTNTPISTVECIGDKLLDCTEIIKLSPNPVSASAILTYMVHDEALKDPFDVYALPAFSMEPIKLASGLSSDWGMHNVKMGFSKLPTGVYRLYMQNKTCASNLLGFVKK